MTVRLQAESLAALSAVANAEVLLAGHIDKTVVGIKESRRDIVTNLDLQLERHIAATLSQIGGPVVGEEAWAVEKSLPPSGSTYWLVDPIDGTVNFVHGLPYFAISVGLSVGGEFLVGAVSLPAFKELYFTYGDELAFLNGRPLKARSAQLGDSLVGVSFPSRGSANPLQHFDRFARVNDRTRGCLRLGSAAAMLCLVAAGRLQAVYGFGAKLWDVAGGIAIASRAGCEVWADRHPTSPLLNYVVAAPGVGEPLRELLGDDRPEGLE